MDISLKKTAAFMALLVVVTALCAHVAEQRVEVSTSSPEDPQATNFVVLKVGGFRAEIHWNN